MTTAPSAPPVSVPTFPAVFDGIGALFVRCDNDPDVQAAKIPGLTWYAPKVNGADASPDAEIASWAGRMWKPGRASGVWVYCNGPPTQDVADARRGMSITPTSFVVYDVEREYKSDEEWDDATGHHVGQPKWAWQLVAEHHEVLGSMPAAVTSYGGYKSSIDFAAFARAGWPVFAQVYDAFKPGDELSYLWPTGPYPIAGTHRLTRSLKLSPGEAVYRPESIDG